MIREAQVQRNVKCPDKQTEEQQREHYLDYWNTLYSKETLKLIKPTEPHKFSAAIETIMNVLTNITQSPIKNYLETVSD